MGKIMMAIFSGSISLLIWNPLQTFQTMERLLLILRYRIHREKRDTLFHIGRYGTSEGRYGTSVGTQLQVRLVVGCGY